MSLFLIKMSLLSLPLVIGGIIHMLVVKKDILSFFKKPINVKWFGQNKTWRGFLVMPLATWPGVLISQNLERLINPEEPLLLGITSWWPALALGWGYCLAELPNSFLKRKLGIKEGQTSEHHKWFFIILDQADSVFGCLVVYKLIIILPWNLFWGTFCFGTFVHLFINNLLYLIKIRKNPF